MSGEQELGLRGCVCSNVKKRIIIIIYGHVLVLRSDGTAASSYHVKASRLQLCGLGSRLVACLSAGTVRLWIALRVRARRSVVGVS